MILLEYLGVGIVISFLLIVLSKVIMAGILQRKPGYYKDTYDEGPFDSEVYDEGGEHHE